MPGNQAINDIFLSWRDHLVRVVSRIVPPHDIEDIVQETYVRACQFDSKDDIRSPGAFMTRIARNLAIDHLKRAEARLTSPMNEAMEFELGQLRCMVDEPFNQTASREEFALFCEAVRQLPLQCRRAFVLKKVYGHSQQEIARALNISENTVEKHIAQGIKRCTLYLRQYSDTGDGSDNKQPRFRQEDGSQ